MQRAWRAGAGAGTSGATLGGAWLAALSSDLGANRFDGAYLVEKTRVPVPLRVASSSSMISGVAGSPRFSHG